MKRRHIQYIGTILLAAMTLSSCSDSFLEDKKNYDNTNVDAYNYYSGALGRVNDIYRWCLPNANSSPSWKDPSTGSADDQSQSTEEYSKFGVFVDPQAELTYQSGNNPVPDYFQGQAANIQQSAWGRIRNCNDVIAGIMNGSITEEEKNKLLGQVYIFRAWCYYNLVKWYGGVPIITEVQDPVETSFVPRSSTKDCVDFICQDLDKATELLAPFTENGGWPSSEDYGRVTSGTAQALKGRLLLLYASPLFNRTNDPTRWENAYNVIKESISVLERCGYGLAYESDPGTNASNWAKMFNDDQNKEAVFVTLYNNLATGLTPDYAYNNNWEHGVRPSNSFGGGGKVPSAMMVDLFPMADGKRPSSYQSYTKLTASADIYEADYPFMNRDPRFYRTFSFPGERWAFNGDARSEKSGSNETKTNNPYAGANYELWNYVWYNKADDRGNIESGKSYGSDNLLANAKGMYVRKRSDDMDVNISPRYAFQQTAKLGFKQSAAPYMEIRFAEVLLNYAEAACGAGHMDEAVAQLKRIRQRVGYTGDCGLQDNLTSDQAACMAAVLYERQIELAYEGKRFDDLRRWMLFDGGTGKVEGAPQTWTLTGWGGNTCTYLGFQQLNGQRRENMEFRVQSAYNNGLGGIEWPLNGTNPDPLKDVERPAALDLRKDLSEQLATLKTFYETYLERNKKKGDAYDSNKGQLYIHFYPKYYFLGLSQGASANNTRLEQNIGWGNYVAGGSAGVFDPLAE